MGPAHVQERGREDVRQAAKIAGLDSVVLGELIVIGHVDKLDDPQQRQEADHDEQRLAGLVEHGLSIFGPHAPGQAPCVAHVSPTAVEASSWTASRRLHAPKVSGAMHGT